MKKNAEKHEDSIINLSQDTVDELQKARTMEEYLEIASRFGIDWEELDDEWLEAIVNGDITDLIWKQQRRQRRAGRKKANEDRV